MKELFFEAAILTPLLLFETWNVCTARRRGAIFLKLRPIIKSVEPEDFHAALALNVLFIGAILAAIALRAYYFLKK
jgi:hypothetical protein